MLPGVYEFTWTTGHLIFLGIFYTVVVVILTSLVLSVLRCRKDIKQQKTDKIRWHADFTELPEIVRFCRHELTGEVKYRLCPNEFDCRYCNKHPEFDTIRAKRAETASAATGDTILGFKMPSDRFYHRGHAWVKPEGDGIYAVGLDDFGKRLIGKPDMLELPRVGTQLWVNGTAWKIRKNDSDIRILSPIEGVVVDTWKHGREWHLKVKSSSNGASTTHLLHGMEIRPWLSREMERLQLSLTAEGASPALADGGLLIDDPASEMAGVNWDTVWGEMFLTP